MRRLFQAQFFQARFFRVLVITGKTYHQTRSSSRAAALSFSSLLGLGPLITLIVILGTPILGRKDSRLGAKALNYVLQFIAPQIHEYEQLSASGAAPNAAPSFNPKLVEIIDSFVAGAHRGSAGTFGALSLALIVFLLFRSIESSFNDIWEVKVGRSIFHSIGFHLVLLAFGAALFFAAAAMLSAGAFINVFIARLPFGHGLLFFLLRWTSIVVSFGLLTGVLALAYRLIPNTKVQWACSVGGALVVTGLLLINNFVAFLYLRRVIMTRSLYGSLGIVPVLMLGLYVFWLFVLIGCQISFAVQKTKPAAVPAEPSNSTLPPEPSDLP